VSAEIIWLCDRAPKADFDLAIDLRTAIDVAIRDLKEVQSHWGSEQARERLLECEAMLREVLAVS
jgi:hypothetical protein